MEALYAAVLAHVLRTAEQCGVCTIKTHGCMVPVIPAAECSCGAAHCYALLWQKAVHHFHRVWPTHPVPTIPMPSFAHMHLIMRPSSWSRLIVGQTNSMYAAANSNHDSHVWCKVVCGKSHQM